MAKRPPNRIETTPSGIDIAYWDDVGVDGLPQQRRYRIGGVDGDRVPSITTISGLYEKSGLMPAAVKLQEGAVIELARSGVDIAKLEQGDLRALLVERGLHYDSVWQVARDRGDVAHAALLEVFQGKRPKRLSHYAPEQRAWISAGMSWVADHNPEVIAAEYIVASIEHGFAGRPDLLGRMRDGRVAQVDFKTVSEWKRTEHVCRECRGKKPCELCDSTGKVPGGLLMPYDENLLQLAGQRIASIESGYEAPDVLLCVRLGPDGEYDVTTSHATDAAFLAALTAYNEKKWLAKPRELEAVAA